MTEAQIKNQKRGDSIVGDKIFLNGQGKFPKKLIVFEADKKLEYFIVKSRNGKYQLNK